jgi:hypothetical protein
MFTNISKSESKQHAIKEEKFQYRYNQGCISQTILTEISNNIYKNTIMIHTEEKTTF